VYANEQAVAAQASVVQAQAAQAAAENSKLAAITYASQAQNAYTSALSATNSYATSASVTNCRLGNIFFVTQAGKNFTVGQLLLVNSRSDPSTYGVGSVLSYSGTGLVVIFTEVDGRDASASDWDIRSLGVIALSGKEGQVLRQGTSGRNYWSEDGGENNPIYTSRNILLYSESLATGWIAEGATSADNAEIAPNGTNTAVLVTANGPAGYNRWYQSISISAAAGNIYTYSAYVKSTGQSAAFFELGTGGGDRPTGAGLRLDFQTGTVNNILYNQLDVILAKGCKYEGSGWWRVWVTLAARVTNTIIYPYIYGNYFAGPVGSTLWWGMQVVKGRYPGQYVKTTSAATNGAGELFVNRLPYGKEPNSAGSGWALGSNTSALGYTVSPTEDQTAWAYRTLNTGVLGNNFIAVSALSLLASTQYTYSIYIKLVSGTLPAQGASIMVDAEVNGVAGLERLIKNFVDVGPAWKRISLTFTTGSVSSSNLYAAVDYETNAIFAVWGAQLDFGPVAKPLLLNATNAALNGAHAALKLRTRNLLDTTWAAITVTVPDVMVENDWFEIEDAGGIAATNNITILYATVGAINLTAANYVISTNKFAGRFVYQPEKGLVLAA
jgi:hypothetical protein